MPRVSPRPACLVCDSCALVRVRTQATKPAFPISLVASSRVCWTPKLVGRKPVATRWASTVAATAVANREAVATPSPPQQAPMPDELAKLAEETRDKFLSEEGIPDAQLIRAALRSCLQVASALHQQVKRAEKLSKASASKLATLGAERTGARLSIDEHLQDAVGRISNSAYAIITHPNVDITAEFLQLYVAIQAQLGRPESLPSVLELYAKKPKAVLRDGQVKYVRQRPNSIMKAVEGDVAEMALQTAIDAQHLDSALGIIEASYCLPAFKRQKLLKYTTAPALCLAALPFGIYGLGAGYAAHWQNTMDVTTATSIGVAGFSGYFFVVLSLGMIAKLSYKDHMKRVTWTPGTPLRYRWLREEERAALDKVACAWGFKEPWRHGEETGPEWEGLMEYMGYRQMLLDRVEFMEGMS